MPAQRRQPLGQRVHAWLSEPEGETFRLGKWRFWFIAVAGLQLLNAGLTALIFQSAGNLIFIRNQTAKTPSPAC